MADLQTMRLNIADDINDSTINTQIDKAINRAIQHYMNYRFWFNETQTTFDLIGAQETYDSTDGFPSDFLKIDRIGSIINGSDIELLPITFQEIKEYNALESQGSPYNYAIYEEKMWVSPVPDRAYSTTVYYRKAYSELVNDTDTNDFTEDCEDLIEARAEWWLYSKLLHDPQNAQIMRQHEVEALRILQRRMTKYVTSGHFRRSGF